MKEPTVDEQILLQLKRITTLIAVALTKDIAIQSDQIEMLDRYGFQPKEIADLLSTTPNTVSVTLSRMRKRSDRAKAQPPKPRKVDKASDL